MDSWFLLRAQEPTGAIRCDQPRVLDLGARRGKWLETVPDSITDDVLARLATILQ